MIKLTQKEKADRYDSLQTAIKYTLKNWEEAREKCLTSDYEVLDFAKIYNKGLADGYQRAINTLELWNDKGE